MTRLTSLKFFAAIALLLLSSAVAARSDASMRSEFLAAEKAWKDKEPATYQRLKKGLESYTLYSYLEYQELKTGFNKASSKKITAFIKKWGGTAPAELIRIRYLNRLAKQGKWKEYINTYDDQDKNITRKCHYLNALIKTGKKSSAFKEVPELWHYGSSRPDACDPVFDAWRKAGKMSREEVWKRVELAINLGHPKTAGFLGKYLSAADRKWLNRWLKLRKDPAGNINAVINGNHFYWSQMVGYGLKRLAGKNAESAVQQWEKAMRAGKLSREDRCIINEQLAKGLYRDASRSTYDFFHKVTACKKHPELAEARVRAALLRQNWSDALTWIGEMPNDLQKEQQWQYWKARALAQTGKKGKAKKIFKSVSDDRSFYAFLASDHLKQRYHYADKKTSVDNGTLNRIKQLPAMQNIYELHQIGRATDVRREWRYLVQDKKPEELKAEAILFQKWGLPDRAIFTLAKSDYWDDLELRFPVYHKNLVTKHAKTGSLDPSWVFAILRQESAFMVDARSGAGALGLMQLMPATAKLVARKIGMARPGKSQILQPETNIKLGSGYLRMMMQRFDNMALASAAYNAGPGRVVQWLYDKPLPTDIWVELIPFKETRTYVKRVMTYASIYDKRLGKRQKKISDRIGVTPTRNSVK